MKSYAMQSFEYKGVELNDSHWRGQRDRLIELYLSLDNDDILARPLQYGGTCSKHHGLGGWGGTLGQFYGSFAKLYRVTGDYRIKSKCISLFESWVIEVELNPKLLHGGTYSYEKLLGGLLDMYEYMDFERASEYISKLTDQNIIDLDPTIDRDGLQDSRMKGQIEWYTLAENLYRAYQLLGDEKYRSYASIWHYDYLWDKLLNNDPEIGPRHAYSQVNSLSSAARAYEVTGDEHYLDILRAGYDTIFHQHTYATGGYGPGENLFMDREGYLGFMIQSPWELSGENPSFMNFAGSTVARSDAWGSCEVSCCTWAVFKLTNYLLQYTGESKYAVWAERLLINAVGGQPDIKPNGDLLYYSDYFIDGGMKSVTDRRLQKHGENFRWQCCSGTYPQDLAEYANMIGYLKDETLHVTQYLPAKIRWTVAGQTCVLDNFSESPIQERLMFRVSLAIASEFTLKFRVPDWATEENAVYINGRKQDVMFVANQWLELSRTWEDDDLIELVFPFKLQFKAVDQKHSDIVALTYGPVVLVCTEMTVLVGDVSKPEDWIEAVPNQKNCFKTLPGHSGAYEHIQRTFVPYYTYPEDKWYFMYNKIYPTNDALMGLESKPMGQN